MKSVALYDRGKVHAMTTATAPATATAFAPACRDTAIITVADGTSEPAFQKRIRTRSSCTDSVAVATSRR